MSDKEVDGFMKEKERGGLLRQRPKDVVALCKVLLFAMQIGIFAASWELMQDRIKIYAQTSILLVMIYVVVMLWLHRTYDSLQVGMRKVSALCTAQLLTLVLGDAMLLMLGTMAVRTLPNLWVFAAMFAAQSAVSVIWCLAINRLYFRITPAARTVVIYAGEAGRRMLQGLQDAPERYDVVRTVCLDEEEWTQESVLAQLEGMETAALCGLPGPLQEAVLSRCVLGGVQACIRPDFDAVLISAARRRFQSHVPVLDVDLRTPSLPYMIIKRTMDVAVSGLLLLLSSPVMAVVAILVRAQDGGPAFYRQKRLTRNGREFEILKFRSMRVDAEKDGVARLATKEDDRITGVGRFIRATRLDELPQLINILRGDMTLVGPRPERPEIAAQYEQELPEFRSRLLVKAGLTGYAQVHGKYNTTPADKLQMDLMYIADMSLELDLKLIFQTVQVMLRRESTEGVNRGSVTAQTEKKKSA